VAGYLAGVAADYPGSDRAVDIGSRTNPSRGRRIADDRSRGVTVTLVGVPKVALDDLIYAHQQSSAADRETTRYCALFDIENTGDAPLHWLSRRTTFIGSDGYTYDRAHVDLDSAELAPGCHTNHVQIEPRCRARVITPVEKLPDGVDVSAVTHTVAASGRPNQRFRFTL